MGDARVVTQTFTRAAFPDMEKVALTAERDALRAQVEALQDRLEMRHAFDGSGKRISVEPGSIPDGISCRDETIRQLDKRVDEYRAQVEAMREALAFYADTSKYPAPLTGGMGALWADCGEIAKAALSKTTGSPDGQA